MHPLLEPIPNKYNFECLDGEQAEGLKHIHRQIKAAEWKMLMIKAIKDVRVDSLREVCQITDCHLNLPDELFLIRDPYLNSGMNVCTIYKGLFYKTAK